MEDKIPWNYIKDYTLELNEINLYNQSLKDIKKEKRYCINTILISIFLRTLLPFISIIFCCIITVFIFNILSLPINYIYLFMVVYISTGFIIIPNTYLLFDTDIEDNIIQYMKRFKQANNKIYLTTDDKKDLQKKQEFESKLNDIKQSLNRVNRAKSRIDFPSYKSNKEI